MTHEQSVIRYFQLKPLEDIETMLRLVTVVVQTRRGMALKPPVDQPNQLYTYEVPPS